MGEAVPIKKADPVKVRAAELKSEHGEVWILSGDEGLKFIVRRPTLDECVPLKVEIEKSQRGKDAKIVAAATRLFRTVCLYPEAELVTEAISRFPFLAERLGEKVLDIAGAAMSVEVEKV